MRYPNDLRDNAERAKQLIDAAVNLGWMGQEEGTEVVDDEALVTAVLAAATLAKVYVDRLHNLIEGRPADLEPLAWPEDAAVVEPAAAAGNGATKARLES